MRPKSKNKRSGFTLVELAIVIVIIGLIVGGVLVGQDLIKAAQVRAVVSQIQSLDAAINTFRSKYDGLPGDLVRAVSFGLATAGNDGDGDGLIRDDDGGALTTFDGEVQQFWRHLSRAQLVAGNYDGTGTALGTDFPDNKLKKGGIVTFGPSGSSLNFYAIAAATGGITYTDGITPVEAFGIDSKLDDGFPDTGIVTAHDGGDDIEGGATTGGCFTNDTPREFAIPTQNNLCGLRVRISG
jgi:prepilin-type N-terminal cleavage/methylation domain-containing protein